MRRKCEEVSGSSADYGPMSTEDVQVDVKYSDDLGNKTPKQLLLNSTTTVSSIEMFVRDEFPNDHESLDLVLQYEDGKEICLSDHKTSCMADLGITLTPGHNYTILVSPSEKRNMSLYVNDVTEDDLLLGASASPTTGEVLSSSASDSAAPIDDYPEHGHCSRCRIGPTGEESSNNVEAMSVVETTNYVGLVNQAMTCYLNSLVQALFMTPEFRNAIYNWEFDGQNEARSIPYQLQKLFLNLQTSTRSAVETTDLTTSFGWQGSEAWHQHDIQELCRVMFDALERKFKDTKQANLINDLYEGTMLDYVKCLECGTEKSREDTFLDIPLPVRPFGSTVAYNSVEEALRAFVQPETLEGNNQYHCEKCNKKCDAHKGLKFIKFPYLLTLHLKRFDFDYNTMHRIKLNDKVVFPEKLNLNSFVPNNRSENDGLEERDTVVRCDECSTTDSGSALDDESCQGTDLSSTVNDHDDNCEDSDEGIDVSSGNAHHENDAKGPYIYELFSIMIHSGSASGGHYYAYIKDFDKNQWLCFNDQSVNRITEEDIKKTYGGGPQKGYYSGVYTSSTNAYMLMYRQIDKDRNCGAMKVEEFPPHMQKLLQNMRNKEKTDRLNKEKQNNSFRLTVNCYHPYTEEMMDVRISLYLDSTLEDAVQMAHRRFKLEGIVNVDDCRMVIFNKKQSCIDCSFESDDLKFCDIDDNYKVCYQEWLLDIREPGTEFTTYKKGGVNKRTYYVNIETEDVREPFMVRIDVGDTVGDVKNKIAEQLETNVNNIKVAIAKFCNEGKYLDDDNATLAIDNTSPDFKLYVTNAIDEDPDKSFENSKFKKIIDRFENIVYLSVLLPDTDPVTLDGLFIPNLDPDKLGAVTTDRTNSPSLRISPQPGVLSCGDNFGDQSNSEDSSLSDSDRTLVGDAPGECQGIFSSSSTSPADQHMTSPMDPAEDMYNYDVLGNPSEEMNWDSHATGVIRNATFFKLLNTRDCRRGVSDANYAKICKVFVDNRMTLETFKKYLESVVRVPKEYFKIYRQYPSPDEEWSNLSDTLRLARDGQTLTVKLGRALAINEFSCKVYLLRPESTETNHFLFEHILTRGQSVGQVKKEILFKAKKQHMLDIQFNRCRLREKCLKKPRKVYLDDQTFSDDILVLSSYELYLQELPYPEKVTSTNQLVLFARHWCPATMTLEPFQEVIIDTPTMSELKTKVAELSNIPVENVQVAFVKSTFPCDMHLLDIHTELEWDPNVTHLYQWPLQVDDGTAFFYRDGREELKELTYEEKKEINIRENTRLGRVPLKSCATLEKSLRIYLDNWPSETEDNCID
ncbi:ubiquitin carboxyl-terminal hydrolase 47 [Tribolium castaneum]|uniref:Ubiquitin carboxyl-terminal hydrolase 47 n=1 Tax=Tribolium castaneum TaxID=7070 RepID=A0A139WJZ2_TRICA|nr:PREDICTED: ubiquitin carboxyl-terminal hydrolase 47 [Tribolium castaneum]KYB28299.1 Ubiquitin carboxyl-terminal hydrolase 64E-like Protein [Tribolium castaneum]|eukprot:XP_968047.1 PREDICTED: ubiquitin carboxyl-terminal hydrolase 47 [Tribolium castaneum]